jgi:hypothetical protein
MANISKIPLSNSTNGRQIEITALSGSTTAIHTAVTGSTAIDEIWIYAINQTVGAETLDILWGGLGAVDAMTVTLAAQTGRTLLIDGKLLNNGLSVTAYASTTSSIYVEGFVNRII